MGVSFKRENTMRFFQEIAFLLLPLLVVGQLGLELEDRDGGIMDTSEKWECYVFGQCEEYSVNFEEIDSAESCHKFCGKNDDCKWWTWEPENSLCSLFANCTDPKQGTGHPDAGRCPNCISGQRECPARECHEQKKCDGFLVDSKKIAHLEECINYCKESVGCEWYTYDKKDDNCVLYEDCFTSSRCDTCATGPKSCSRGYHGDDEEVAEAVTEAVAKASTEEVYEDNLDVEGLIERAGCQQMYSCQGTSAGFAGRDDGIIGVWNCAEYCAETESCEYYTWGTWGTCHLYMDCDRKEPCPDCASGSMEFCYGG